MSSNYRDRRPTPAVKLGSMHHQHSYWYGTYRSEWAAGR
jgi:hypothetical protein